MLDNGMKEDDENKGAIQNMSQEHIGGKNILPKALSITHKFGKRSKYFENGRRWGDILEA